MRYLSSILFVFTFEAVKNTDIVCNRARGRSFHIVNIGEGDSYSFKTKTQQPAGFRKAPRTRCVVMYRRDPTCLEMRFHCSRFHVKNRRTNCRGLDRMEIMTPTEHKDFCRQNGPDKTTSGKFLKVTYLSKNKKQSPGEVCNMACVMSHPIPTFVETTTESFFTKLGPIEGLGFNPISASEASCKMVNGICQHPLLATLVPVLDNSCNSRYDCRKPGKRCHQIMDVGCICKKGQCKIASGCGTMGAFFFRNCTGCRLDGCEDEGACLLVDGKCQEKPTLTFSKPTFAIPTPPPLDNSCNTGSDCWKAGKRCHMIQDVGCICKKGQCKISSGCGTHGAFFYQNCTGCSPDGCEDEGACILKDGVCQDPLKSTPTNPTPLKKTSAKPTSVTPIYEPPLPSVDNSCKTGADCYKDGKICQEIFDVGCVCKQGQCKIPSVGCGTWGFSYQNCTGCSPDKCTDEGACVLLNGKCQEIPDEITGPLENPEHVQSNYCNTMEDCQMYGMCGITGDTKCVCKKGQCEKSSGCGSWEDSIFRNCTDCTPEGCEDEGVCWLEDGECRGPNNPCKTWTECDKISPKLFPHGKQRKMTT